MKILIALVFTFFTQTVYAEKRVLLARASDVDGFPARANCFFSNNKMVPHAGYLLVHYSCFSEGNVHAEIWSVSKTQSRLVFKSRSGNLFSAPLSLGASVFVLEFNEGGTVGFFEFNQLLITHPLPKGFDQLHDLAQIGGKVWARGSQNGVMQALTFDGVKWTVESTRGVSYFFSAASSPEIFLQKVRLGDAGELNESRPDLMLLGIDGAMHVVLADRDADPQSKYLGFWNFSVVLGSKWLAIARTEKGDVAIVGDKLSKSEIELFRHFKTIDVWPAALTPDGTIIVRGESWAGVKGLWKSEADGFKLILTHEDTLMTDLGLAVVGEKLFYNAPVADTKRVYIGVGLREFGGRTPLGQGVVGISLD